MKCLVKYATAICRRTYRSESVDIHSDIVFKCMNLYMNVCVCVQCLGARRTTTIQLYWIVSVCLSMLFFSVG